MNTLGFSLKKIKHVPEMSEETECFVAELYHGKKLIAYVQNQGFGGPTDYRFVKPEYHKTYTEMVPPSESKYINSFEDMIDDLLFKHLQDKEIKRINKWVAKYSKTHVVFTKDGTTYEATPLFGNSKQAVIEAVLRNNPNATIMNQA